MTDLKERLELAAALVASGLKVPPRILPPEWRRFHEGGVISPPKPVVREVAGLPGVAFLLLRPFYSLPPQMQAIDCRNKRVGL